MDTHIQNIGPSLTNYYFFKLENSVEKNSKRSWIGLYKQRYQIILKIKNKNKKVLNININVIRKHKFNHNEMESDLYP